MKVISSEFVTVAADQLKPHPGNPHRGNEHAIGESIQANGWFGALVVRKETGEILAGWHRYLAGCAAGMTEFPVVYVQCTATEAKRILLADNRTRELAGYDIQSLHELLSGLAESYGEGELAGTGYDPEDVKHLAEQIALNKEPAASRGGVWPNDRLAIAWSE